MTIDGMMIEDVERIFERHTCTTLRDINFKMGNKVLDVWIDTGTRQAHKDHILPYHLPEYLESYIKKRYEAFTKEAM